ncbi:hypothetical protein FA09DRAFT_145876 [Tilletiopsis washingtonensis]|uniref:Uncharacterized protein n=1 Tax=Tilletiopsis washingtonensis TaxID=58919 RepID=A0A316Z2Z9_9BASI|nr:hypothetical protein FA09DRAFT_145876 [Tilletiopsis washingtonensis]PWN95282.1 hypothetical protein FA09DRAFT_145876 [Tilletiopsis washingtonensis]
MSPLGALCCSLALEGRRERSSASVLDTGLAGSGEASAGSAAMLARMERREVETRGPSVSAGFATAAMVGSSGGVVVRGEEQRASAGTRGGCQAASRRRQDAKRAQTCSSSSAASTPERHQRGGARAWRKAAPLSAHAAAAPCLCRPESLAHPAPHARRCGAGSAPFRPRCATHLDGAAPAPRPAAQPTTGRGRGSAGPSLAAGTAAVEAGQALLCRAVLLHSLRGKSQRQRGAGPDTVCGARLGDGTAGQMMRTKCEGRARREYRRGDDVKGQLRGAEKEAWSLA